MDQEQFKKRLEMLDKRLDNIDSVVTALVERVSLLRLLVLSAVVLSRLC
jgi:hypothetical protein